MLYNAGRELANTWMSGAVTHAKDLTQMQNQMLILQVAARHVISTAAFNYEVEKKADGDAFIDRFAESMKHELEGMRKSAERGEMETIEKSDTPRIIRP